MRGRKDEYTENHVLSKGESNHLMFSNGGKDLSADFLTTKATTVLEKQNWSLHRDRVHRCLPRNVASPEKLPGTVGYIQDSMSTKQNDKSAEDGLLEEDKSSVFGLSKSSIISESSLRPLTGKASEILQILKINLLDMDAALPEDALRVSRSDQDRRCAWRAFVKSATSIYEMVQTTIILEDTIKSEYLHSDWWYWSSPSTAAQITTLCALALRIYMLDSAISYEKPFPSAATEVLEPNRELDVQVHTDTTPTNLMNPISPSLQKTSESGPVENPETSSRASKRRKISNS